MNSRTLIDGLKHISEGKFETAHTDAIAMIKRNVNDPVPYYLLGEIAFEHSNFQKAEELFDRACELESENSRYHAARAKLLTKLNRQNEAVEAANKASGLLVDDAFVADNIGVTYSRTGFHEKAVPLFEKAVSLNSTPANFFYNLGASLQFSGEFERAETAYLKAIDRQPDLYRAWSSLVSLSKQTDASNRLEQLVVGFEASADDPDAKLHLGHAIAKTLEDLGRYTESLKWLERAKQKKRSSLGYDVSTDMNLFDAAKSTLQEGWKPRTSDGPDPIFIVGLPRTGTTLVDRILSSHPDVVSAGELNTFAGLVKSGSNSPSNLVLDIETLAAASHLNLTQIGKQYYEATRDLRRGARRMTDKMPLNFFYAGLIHLALPNARIVCLRRDAMDSCLSNYRQLFSTGFSYYNYTLRLEDTARYYSAFDDLVSHWRRVLPLNRFLEVNYEDIVFDQENQTRKLLEFCDLEWNDACLHFHENTAPVSTASSVQVRQPLYSGSIGRWKKYGSTLDSLKAALGSHFSEDH